MQGIVVNERRNWALRGQKVNGMLNCILDAQV